MTQIAPSTTVQSGGVSNDPIDTTQPGETPVDSPPADASAGGGDWLASYGATHGLHASAQFHAYAPQDGGSADTAVADGSAGDAKQDAEAGGNSAAAANTPIVTNERKRVIGNATIKTHSEIAPADAQRAREMTALQQAKGFESVKSYVDAIGARDRHAQPGDGEQRAAGGLKRPPGVSDTVWNASLALQKEGISQDDVTHYLATGALPDLLDEQGRVVMTGEQRLQKLDNAARNGSWTAVNSFTFLIGMRRSHLASEREALAAQRAAVPAGSPLATQLDAAIRGSGELDRELHGKLQTLYKVASYAREADGQKKIARATHLAAEAEKAHAAKDIAKAKDLEAQATKLRNEGAVIAHHEAKYRASIKAFEPDRAFRLAAQAQIDAGAAKVEAMASWRVALTEKPPSELGNTTEAQNANGVPGAQTLLAEAAKHDKTGNKNHASLALENARQGTLAKFHSTHIQRSGYFDRVDEKGNRPAPRSANAVEHRSLYLDARAEQSRVLMERMKLYGDVTALNEKDAAAAGRVATDHANVTQELASAMGTSMRTDAAVAQQTEFAGKIDAEAEKAGKQADEATKRAGEQAHQSSRQRSAADAVFGDTFKWADNARRDRAAVADANSAEKITNDMAAATADQATQVRNEARDANDKLRGLQFQQGLDRADAELARKAFAKAEPGARAGTVGTAYESARASGDSSVRIAERAADRVKTAPADAAQIRLDAARYWTASTEVDRSARGDAGKSAAPDRLANAKVQIDKAYVEMGKLEAGGDERAAVAGGVVDQKAALGEAIAEFDSREARHQLSTAETIGFDELRTRPAALAEAQGRIGAAGINAVVRADGHLEDQRKAGTYDPNAKDQMYLQSRRLLQAPGVAGDKRFDEARALHAKVTRALDEPPKMLQAAMGQLERGTELASALSGAMSRGEIEAVQGPISRVISGPVWLFSGGNVDMQESLASTIENGSNTLIKQLHGFTGEARQGMQDLVAGYAKARSEGQAFRYLDSMRIMSIQPTGTNAARTAEYLSAKDYVKAHFPEGRRDTQDWSMFSIFAWNEKTGAPVAHAIRQPVLDMEEATRTLGDARLAVVARPAEFMLTTRRDQLESAIDDNKNRTRAKIALEFVLVLVTTRGMGGGAAAAKATETGLAAARAAEAATALGSLMRATAVFRQAHPLLYTAAATTAVGAGMAAVNYGAQRLFGRGSPVAQSMDMVMNVLPIGAGHKFAGIASAERRLATIEAQTLAHVEKTFSVSAFKAALGFQRIVAHARFYAPQVVLGLGQMEAARVLLPGALKAMGLERSEFAERALHVILNTLGATGIAAVVNWRAAAARNAAMAEQIVRATAEGRPAAIAKPESARLQKAVQQELATFNKQIGNRMPTGDEMAKLKTAIGDKLGLDMTSDRGRIEAQILDGLVEGVRVERAAALGTRVEDHPTERDVHKAVEATAERLYESRGGEAANASRALAFRDAAAVIANDLGSRAAKMAQEPGKSGQADQLLKAQNWAGDRAAAAELAATTVGVGPREAARLEGFYAVELGRARVLLDAPGNKDMSAYFAAAEARAVKEVGVARDVAQIAMQQLRSELFTQGIARTLTAQQVAAGATPLSNGQIAKVSREMAMRVGIGKEGAELLSRDVAESRATLERAGVVQAGGETQPERAFRELRAANRELVDSFSNLDGATFVRAFGEKPDVNVLRQLANVQGFKELAAADPVRARAVLDNPPALSGQPGNAADRLLVRGEPFTGGNFPGQHTGVDWSGMQRGRAIFTSDLDPAQLPYKSELRPPAAAQPQLPTTFAQLPIAPVARVTDGVLASRSHNGSGGLVRLAELADGTPVAIKKHHGNLSQREALREARSVMLMSELGGGPRFHGVYQDSNGHWNVVMDIVPGDSRGAPVTDRSFRDLEDIIQRLAGARMYELGDFQPFRTREGRILVIDPIGMAERVGQRDTTPPGQANSSYTYARAKVLDDADATVGIRYLERLRTTDPVGWRGLMEKIQERVTPSFEQRFGTYMQRHNYPILTRQP